MSLESVVIAVSLLLGIVVLVLIIYLISRVNDLEAKAFSSQGTANPAEKKTENESQKVFGGLSGRQLWDEWVSIANGGDDQYGIKGDRERFLALLELHVRSVIKTGMEHGAAGANEQPSNPLKIKMLRGEFESYLPSSQASRLYELGRELGASEDAQQRATLREALAETVDAVSMGIDAGSSFVDSAMRDVLINPPESESNQELVPADNPESV
jgi:hypothetical protein|tara:strand:+ start:720 stop:1358 length:639 start_codon:yes stop_codon:yes gene_type:complete